MKKKIGIVVVLMAVTILATPLLGIAYAKKPVVTGGDGYTEYVGTLGGANYVIRIPNENWNGMLVVGCHGYMAFNWNPDAQFAMDNLPQPPPPYVGLKLPFALVAEGYAYAASSYGERGFAIQKAMIRTHQLTQYVIGNFGVTGKVFIVGQSMGGLIGLLLGEKYPELYDGVLDISGMRDIVLGYTDSIAVIAGITADWDEMTPEEQAVYGPLRDMLVQMVADMEAECGGTYDDKPQHYERLNPVDNAEISIPIISVTGAGDPLSVNQVHTFENAVAEAGCSEYYKLYVVPGGHANAPTIIAALNHFEELVDYPVGW
ncbi:MAG: alpha/beta hydrolase-fold protein [Candidatus Bathyarchaeota archaeon]